jgi:hypothetical protein
MEVFVTSSSPNSVGLVTVTVAQNMRVCCSSESGGCITVSFCCNILSIDHCKRQHFWGCRISEYQFCGIYKASFYGWSKMG